MGDHEDINLRMAEGQVKMGEDGWNKRAYVIGDISTVPKAYFIGISDDGSIGNGDEGSEGTDGRLPLYKKIAHTTE